MVYPQQCRITDTNDTPEAYFIKLKDFWFKFKCLLIGRPQSHIKSYTAFFKSIRNYFFLFGFYFTFLIN